MRSEHSVEVVSDRLESQPCFVLVDAVEARPELNSRIPLEGKEPVPTNEHKHDYAKCGIQNHDEIHRTLVRLAPVRVVVPD